MTRPNPLWGIHAAPGLIVGALVRRRDDGSYEVVDRLEASASADPVQVLAEALAVCDRRGVRGRAALLSIPDTEGCYTTAQIPDDELYMNEQELFRELYEYTPYEPEDGVVVCRRLADEGERRYAVCGLPAAYLNPVMTELATLDPAYHGIGLTSSSLVRGSRALGLVGEHGFLLDVQLRMSVLYALDGELCNRYLIPVGATDVREDPQAGAALARDVLQQTAYHVEQHLGSAGEEIVDPQKDVVLVGPHVDDDLRQRVGAVLVDRLAPVDWRPGESAPVTGPDGGALDAATELRSVAAIGAAIEAFQDTDDRLVLRHPPDDVPEYAGDGRPWWHWVTAAVLVIALGGAGAHFFAGPGGGTHDPDVAANDPNAAERAETLEHAALRSAYAQAVESLLEIAAGAPPHLRARHVEMDAGGLAYDVTLALRGEPRVADVAVLRELVGALPSVSDTGVELRDDRLLVRFTARARTRAPADGTGVERRPPRSTTPTTGVLFVRQRLAGIGLLEPAADGAPDEITTRIRAAASIEALAALGYPVDSPPPATVTLDVDGDDTLLRARMGGPSAGRAPLSEAEAGYVRRAAGRAEALGSLDFERAAGAFSPTAAPPSLEVVATAAARVRVSYGPGPEGRELQRSPASPEEWQTVAGLGAAAGQFVDDVWGPSGAYAWRTRAGGRTLAESDAIEVPVPVDVELVGAGDGDSRARFRLARAWRGDTAVTTTDVGVGDTIQAAEPLPADDGARRLSFRTEWRVTAIRTRTVTEQVTVRVPRLLPDGKVERDRAGRPVMEERRVERAQPHLEVDAQAPDRPTRTWVRKMTDG